MFTHKLAYTLGADDLPIPVSRASLYRWEKMGWISLTRIGGKTVILDSEIDRILSGEANLPAGAFQRAAVANRSIKRRGRKPKVKASSETEEFA
jgi:hypothetical protein